MYNNLKRILAVVSAIVVSGLAAQAEGTAKGRRCEIVFSGYEGTETLKDFPALIKIPDGLAGFDYAEAAENGQDIAFYGEDGRPLEREIDTWNPEGDSYIWVRVPELKKGTRIKAEWGKTKRKGQTEGGGQDVWNEDYLAVWHFSKFRDYVTLDAKNGLAAEVRGKDRRKFIHADAFVGKGYYAAAAHPTEWGTYLNVPDDPRWTAYSKTGRLTVSFMVNSTIKKESEIKLNHARILSNKRDYGDELGFEVAIAGFL